MKTGNIKQWRSTSEMREQLMKLNEAVNGYIQESEYMREALDAKRQDIAEEVEDMLREEYEMRMQELEQENRRLKRCCEEYKQKMEETEDRCDKLLYEQKTRMEAVRSMLGCQVTNVEGNYIETLKVRSDNQSK